MVMLAEKNNEAFGSEELEVRIARLSENPRFPRPPCFSAFSVVQNGPVEKSVQSEQSLDTVVSLCLRLSRWSSILERNRDGENSTRESETYNLSPVTYSYYARNRNYDPSLGRWINQDPLQYINGANTYQFVMSNPVGNVDPWGLSAGETTNKIGGAVLTPVLPGSELLESVGALPFWLRWKLEDDVPTRFECDQTRGVCEIKDLFYMGLYNWQQGYHLTGPEHLAVQDWINKNGSTGFWQWLGSKF